ncbi:MAG TPA: allantoate deiminase [Tissierellaceae bacterium]|nr:allantoate deiminase [Tissierellaceae bacterium]
MDNFLTEIENNIEWLTSFGKDPKGGITRLLYTDSWLDAQKSLKERFEELGMNTYFDDIGNLFGRVEGTELSDETIMTGSHVDTVVNGGMFDGQLGILGGMMAVQNLIKKHGKPKRSIEVISMAEEEGSRFPYVFWGSKNIFGLADEEEMKDVEDSEGKNFVEEMKRCGFDFNKDNTAREDIKAFVELHIEQGNTLEIEEKSIGVVTDIAGQRRYEVELKGEANHAGTTLMKYRKDTVEAFSRIVSESLRKAKEEGDPLVLTFGHVEPKPNTVNVVPGETIFSIDCRHTNMETLKNFTEDMEKTMENIADEMGIDIEINRWMDAPPVPMDDKVISIVENACKNQDLNYKVMHSGAGHDAQIFGPRVPTGMLFVPSIKGISHNPAEKTETKDLAQGIRALEATLYELAYK